MNSPFFDPTDDDEAKKVGGAGKVAADVSASLHRVHLSDVQRVLALFTQGLSGQYLHLRPIEAAAMDTDGQVRTEGATTDGTVIYLPAAVESFASERHNSGVYRIAILHQLGFFRNGTFAFSMNRARERIPDLPPESAESAASDRKGLARFFSLWKAPALMRRTFIMLEDLRIDTAIRRHYPGARQDLERVLAHSLARRPDAGELEAAPALWERLLQYTLGAKREDLIAADETGMLAAVLDAADAVVLDKATVYDSARAAMACYAALMRVGHGPDNWFEAEADEGHPPLPAGEGDEFDPDKKSQAFDENAIGGAQVDFRGELNPEFVDDELYGDGSDTLPDDADFKPPDEQVQDTGKRSLRRPRPGGASASDDEHEGARSFLYDEWDYLHESYLKGWCRLFETRLTGDDYDFMREVHRQHATLSAQVKRRFKFIKPESLRRVRRVSDGEELELDGVIEAVLDRRAGYATDDRVYSRRDRALREVAAAFLLDMSASTDYPLPDKDAKPPEPVEEESNDYPMHLFDTSEPRPMIPALPKRRVIDVARESLALMCEALGTLGDSHAIYGFSGQGRKNVEFYVAKEFEDKLTTRTWAALAAMKAQRSTRMGPAIRHALTKLERQPARMKVLIVISDGYPQDFDYGPDRTSDEYGIQDTARALLEAETQGVHTFCITIDPSGHDYLRRMCRENTYMVIDEVADLPGELVKVYRALTV